MAIFDTDVLYATRLMEYFKKSEVKGFDVLLFTKKEFLVEFLEYQAVEILLYGGEDLSKVQQCNNIKYLFLLCANRRLPKDNFSLIYKFQPASKIGSDVLSLYTRLEDCQNETAYGDVRLISVFSPVPNVEKMSFSWSLAKNISERGKVLFIPFELLPSAYTIPREEGGQSLSEFLYYLKESKTDPIDKMKSYLSYSEKLSYLSGLTHGFDLLSISKEDMCRFIDGIREHKDYEMVIFYLGIYTEAAMEVLKRSDEVCIIISEGNYEDLVLSEWERQIEILGCPIHELKHHLLRIPFGGSELEGGSIASIAQDFAKQMYI